jgi:hypothetical protein
MLASAWWGHANEEMRWAYGYASRFAGINHRESVQIRHASFSFGEVLQANQQR